MLNFIFENKISGVKQNLVYMIQFDLSVFLYCCRCSMTIASHAAVCCCRIPRNINKTSAVSDLLEFIYININECMRIKIKRLQQQIGI